MAEPINLNRALKVRARAAEKARAAENRALHGRTKAERQAEAQTRERLGRALDGARCEADVDEVG